MKMHIVVELLYITLQTPAFSVTNSITRKSNLKLITPTAPLSLLQSQKPMCAGKMITLITVHPVPRARQFQTAKVQLQSNNTIMRWRRRFAY